MCGRITQTRALEEYGRAVGWTEEEIRRRDIGGYRPEFNAAPGVPHLILRNVDDQPTIEMVAWRWLSGWAKKEGIAPAINAKREKLLGGYYRSLMKTGRVIVPADGWYEWTAEKSHKQPWYIKAKNDTPLFFAGLTNHFPDQEDEESTGFVIVTDDAAGGMVDIHGRRPVALSAEDARTWMDMTVTYEQAEQIARQMALGPDCFEWFKVSTDVNRASNHDAHLIEPI
ncbi:SOS response-associated peptidase [Collimonas humicola]|uniref:SOS response-associated peptidase n=1 Tax=Collimonas humicola TaxID=2825886 RepID=UPI001B8C8145|nr:SOS response-associated peptidase [Collimonas humicola]